jgi:outer membrane protein assembly factor BamB
MLLAAATLLCLQNHDWPQWRGPQRDGVSAETGLLREWPSGGPRLLWQVDAVGVGYSSLAVKGGRIYTQGDLDGVEHVICLAASDGRVIWAAQPEPAAKRLAARVADEARRMDRDGDGVVDEVEALGRLGWNFNPFEKPEPGDPAGIAEARAKRLLKKVDADGNGKIDLLELVPGLREKARDIDREDKTADAVALARFRADAVVAALDADKDGSLIRSEYSMSPLSPVSGSVDTEDPASKKRDEVITREELTAYFQKSERGKDGVLTCEELAAYYQKQFPGNDGLLTAAEIRASCGGYRNGFGDGPRGSPTIDGDVLYAEGGSGDLTCIELATGKTLWHVNLIADLGGSLPGWGYSESPLVLGEHLIVTPGGKRGTLAALDKKTGKEVWRSKGLAEGAHYSSPVVADLGGVRTIVQMGAKSTFGVRAEDGKPLWTYTNASNGTANICTPLPWKDHVFASSAYGTGGGLVRIAPDGAKAEEVYFEKRMQNHHGGIVRVGDFMYGFGNGGLICMDFITGKTAWNERSVGKGSLVVADGLLFLLGENHQMALAEVDPKGYRERGRFKIDNLGRASWAHPVVVDGRLLIRNQKRLAAYGVKS